MTDPAPLHECRTLVEAASIAFVGKLKSLNPNAEGWLRLSEEDKMTVRRCMAAALHEVSKAMR